MAYDFDAKSLTPNKHKIDFVVTHGSCPDGYMSQTIIRKWLKSILTPDEFLKVTFMDAYYGNDFSKLPEMMRDHYVVICDFSFPKVLFDRMIEETKGNILVLDHHKTAQQELKDVESKYVTFDMKHSGAYLTWCYFFGSSYIPKAVLYVEDHDIWTKALPQTDDFTAFLASRKFEYEEYDKLFSEEYLYTVVFPTGAGITVRNNQLIDDLTKYCVVNFMKINKRYYFVACLNTARILRSEVGSNVLKVFRNANFSMIYAHDFRTNSTAVSYRSTDIMSDTTEIAKITGGGGHRNASGTEIPFICSNPPGQLIDTFSYSLLDNLYTVDDGGMFGEQFRDKKLLVINTPIHGKHLVEYLMQERYDDPIKNKPRTDAGLPGYQEGLFCMRNKTNNQDLDEVYDGAVAWHIVGFDKKHVIAKFLSGENVEIVL